MEVIASSVRESDPLPELECLWALVETVGEGITFSDQHGRFVVFNAKMEEITGYTKDEANATSDFSSLIYPDPREHTLALDRLGGLLRHGRLLDIETTITAKDGSRRTLLVSTTIVSRTSGQYFFSTYRDMTERLRVEESLRQERDFINAVMQMMGGLVLVLDPRGRVERMNRACEDLSGRTFQDVAGREYWDVFLPLEDVASARIAFSDTWFKSQPAQHESRWQTCSGEHRLISWCSTVIVDPNGQSRHVIGTGTDITERRQQELALQEANAHLERLATIDSLTGLMNRRAFFNRICEETDRAARYSMPLSLLILDIDRFKDYNDAYGHPAGDLALQITGNVLRNSFRGSDLVARYGGEEFVVLLPHADLEDAVAAAERFRHAIETTPWPHRALTVSVGAASFGDATASYEALISEADRALYEAKRSGRNRVVIAGDGTVNCLMAAE